jgi:membrane-bound lytic murein transglycosylase A
MSSPAVAGAADTADRRRSRESSPRTLASLCALLALALLAAGCAPHGRRPPSVACPPCPSCPPCPPAPTPTPVPTPEPTPVPTPLPDRLDLVESTFGELPGWGEDTVAAAVPALARSCAVLRERPPGAAVGSAGVAGTVADWLPLCDAAASLRPGDDAAARAVFERLLRPVALSNRGQPEGLFTGYYEPTLRGSRRPGGAFRIPLYLRPPELVMVDLGKFRESLRGTRIAGRVSGGELLPFHDRAAIDEGALHGRDLELVWVDDPVDAFFLEIQGSGRVELVEGGILRVGYAAQNGHPYYAIGRELVARGAMTVEEVSMQSIRDWLAANPEEAVEVMRTNASYVFFRELTGEGPLGAQGVALTPGRSLAVDPRFLPYGAPLWLDTTYPGAAGGGATGPPLRRLMVAQDTGGAIRGPVRGDVFWGPGDEAAELAGRMRQPGRLWLLLPRTVALPVPAEEALPPP